MFGMEPVLEIFVWSVILSLTISIVYRVLTRPEEIRKVKEDTKFYQEKMKKAQKEGDMKRQKEYMDLVMKQSSKQFRAMMKPMIVSLFIFIIVLPYLSGIYGYAEGGLGVAVNLPFWLPLFGTDMSWFWFYVVAAMPFTIIFRKFLGVE